MCLVHLITNNAVLYAFSCNCVFQILQNGNKSNNELKSMFLALSLTTEKNTGSDWFF